MVDSGDPKASAGPGISPYDTATSATLRFLVELVAWIAGPWAVVSVTELWWTAIPAVIVLVGSVSVFSTPGDKNQVVVATPGPVRLVIEVLLAATAVIGAWIAWPPWVALLVLVIVVAAQITGFKRTRWLAVGAPTTQ